MKVLVATQKPFSAAAVAGIKEIVEGAGHEFAALAEADCTEREFCESFFRPDAAQDGATELREYRRAVAEGGATAEKAVREGIFDGDPVIRRAAYLELSRIDPGRFDSLLEVMADDTSREVGSLALDFIRALPAGKRRDTLLSRVEISRAGLPTSRQ